MDAPIRTIETRLAQMTLVEPGLIEQRFRSGITLDREGLEENRRARQELSGGGPHVMMSVFPEDVDFQLSVISEDHFAPDKEPPGLKALALVTAGQFTTGLAAIVFKYFPPQFPASTMGSEEEARAWLRGYLPP